MQENESKCYVCIENTYSPVIQYISEEGGRSMVGVKMGIDFGSANLTVFVEGRGIVFSEPSVMICDVSSGEILAIGHAANKMLGKLPSSMKPVFPIRDGVVFDFDAATMMLGRIIEMISEGRLFRPSVLLCVPSTVTDIAKKSLRNVVLAAGAGRACFVGEALAAAVGAGVSLTEPKGVCVCDIGGSVTDCAVITMGNIATSKTVYVGGSVMTQAIIEHVLHCKNIELGTLEADMVKRTVGSAVPRENEIAVSACGKNIDTGLPCYTEVTSTEVYKALKPYLDIILNCLRDVMEETSPALCGDLLESGVILTGGTSNLYGMDELIQKETGVKAVCADEAEQCAAAGIGRLLKNMKYLERYGFVFETNEEEKTEKGANGQTI